MNKCEQCIVKQFNALKTLSKNDLIRISGCKTSKRVKKGEILFREGEKINGIYCIKEGICKLTKLSSNGKDQILKLVVKGDLIGQRSLVTDEASNLSATAINEMEVCFIPKQEVLHDLKQNPSFSLDLLQEMAKELRNSENDKVDLAQKSVKQRLAETLLYLQDNFGVNETGFLAIVLSREDFANLVGTATESAIRILSKFKKNGFIQTEGKRIKITNLQALKQIE